jgi:hypothetical protein
MILEVCLNLRDTSNRMRVPGRVTLSSVKWKPVPPKKAVFIEAVEFATPRRVACQSHGYPFRLTAFLRSSLLPNSAWRKPASMNSSPWFKSIKPWAAAGSSNGLTGTNRWEPHVSRTAPRLRRPRLQFQPLRRAPQWLTFPIDKCRTYIYGPANKSF